MRRSLTILLILFAAAAYTPLRAQSLDAFKERLAAPVASDAAFGTAKVTVTEYGDAARAVDEASRAAPACVSPVTGSASSSTTAGRPSGAIAAKQLFEENYPGIKVYMVYENPYFKVAVGDCLTTEEAIILKGRVSSAFPKAFVKNETLSIADLLN